MAIDVTLDNVGGGYNRSAINDNFDTLLEALQDAVSRSGVVPNDMSADFDMGGNDILNAGTITTNAITVDGETLVTALMSKGDRGWAPQFAIESDGDRRVFKLIGYVNGEGDVPNDDVGKYVGATQMETLIANGIDVRGPTGATGPGSGDMVAAQNLSDVASVSTAFANIKQDATTSATGVVEIATSAEVLTGTDATRSLTPALLRVVVPLGVVWDFTGPSAPSGFVFPFGQAVSRTTYAAYFALVGTTYGAGDGSTTFNVPDLRGRVSAGKDDMGGTSADRLTNQTNGIDGDTLGAVGGAETHTLTVAQMPAHSHTLTVYNSDPAGGVAADGSGGATANPNTSSVGGGGAHNNVQPTIVMNKILFVGA